jgi:hypothetical protein
MLMNKIIANGKSDDMEHLGDLFNEMVSDIKAYDYEEYKRIEFKLYCMVYGEHLSEELATKWVKCMENKDGTRGEHWTFDQTESVRKQHSPTSNPYDWYATLNMMYSDYYSPKFDTDTYIALAKNWITDTDVPEGKTLRYYWYVVKD